MKAREFFGHVYHDNDLRRQNRRVLSRDLMLYGRNALLSPVERVLRRAFGDDRRPIGFIVGVPRSGTTLLFQLAARHLAIGYPSNTVARYWSAPLAGQLLYEQRRPATQIPLGSSFGGTRGPDAPHEFSWFWTYHMPFETHDELSDAALDAYDWVRIRQTLQGLTGLTGRPWLYKSLNATVFHIARFARELPQSRFVYIRRDPRFIVQSILKCREQRYGDTHTWWTIRPRGYEAWLELSDVEQVCRQVEAIQHAVERDIASLDPSRVLTLDYEELVAHPRAHLNQLAELLDTSVMGLEALSRDELVHGNRVSTSPERFAQIEQRLAQ